jgi:hypothetical protein
MTKLLLALALAVLCSALGCAKTQPRPAAPFRDPAPSDGPAPSGSPAPSGAPGSTGGAAPSGSPTKAPENIAVYIKQGGFAGFDTRLEIREDGSMTYTDNKTKQTRNLAADPALLRQLREVLAKPELVAAAGNTSAQGADLMTYGMIVQTTQGQRGITTTDAAHPPQIVSDLQSVLDQLWAYARTH